jgi:hypothetical protein
MSIFLILLTLIVLILLCLIVIIAVQQCKKAWRLRRKEDRKEIITNWKRMRKRRKEERAKFKAIKKPPPK